GSPRGERSVGALCSRGDGNHADREFTLADVVLSRSLRDSKAVSAPRPRSSGLAGRSHPVSKTLLPLPPLRRRGSRWRRISQDCEKYHSPPPADKAERARESERGGAG